MGLARVVPIWGTMDFVSIKQKISKLERKFGAKKTDDPDGVMAVLQIAKRLLSERGNKDIYIALDEALDMAVPKDRARTWWGAHRAIVHALPDGFLTIGDYTILSGTTSDDVVRLLERAVLAQGSVNLAGAKLSKHSLKKKVGL